MTAALLFSVFVIATCGLVYELIAATLASYLLGDSVTQFSTVIGVYLFSMGIGSFVSKYFTRNLIFVFVEVEILIGWIGGFSASLLFVAFDWVSSFRILLYSLVSITGILVGLEIPLILRILKNHLEFRDLVSKVFTFDYIGALLASLLFPLVLIPHLGLIRSSFLFGILNVLVGLGFLVLFKKEIVWAHFLKILASLTLATLLTGFIYSEKILSFAEAASYPDSVIYARSSSYQRIVLTKASDDLRLFLNGNLQFSSRDEYRYHEALVHPGLAAIDSPKSVLILGGGDGLAAREVLKYPSIEKIKLVDLDAEMTQLFSSHDALKTLNANSLNSSKMTLVHADAFTWLRENKDETFDFIVIDFPDPSNYSIGKLYTDTFYRLIKQHLNDYGIVAIQSTSPYVAKKSFSCIEQTLKSVGFYTAPYHAYVPSFGDWGYFLASLKPIKIPEKFPEDLKFIDAQTAQTLFEFPKDQRVEASQINRLNNQILVRYFEQEWSEYLHGSF